MKSPLLPAAAAVALIALSACQNKKEEVSNVAPDPLASEIANRAPVELPPAIKADVSLRCDDNSLLYVTFFDGDKQVVVKTSKDGTPTKLTADKAGDPLTGNGWTLSGDTKKVKVTEPGKSAQSCNAFFFLSRTKRPVYPRSAGRFRLMFRG
jgi:hypothetical protein